MQNKLDLDDYCANFRKTHTPKNLTGGVSRPSKYRKCEDLRSIAKSIIDLAKILTAFAPILRSAHESKDEDYRNKLLAFIGDKIIRDWPCKDYIFISDAAKQDNSSCVEEHFTPISYFRDFISSISIDSDPEQVERLIVEFFIRYYRVVKITKNEDRRLPRTYRPTGQEYKAAEILITSHHWENYENEIRKEILFLNRPSTK